MSANYWTSSNSSCLFQLKPNQQSETKSTKSYIFRQAISSFWTYLMFTLCLVITSPTAPTCGWEALFSAARFAPSARRLGSRALAFCARARASGFLYRSFLHTRYYGASGSAVNKLKQDQHKTKSSNWNQINTNASSCVHLTDPSGFKRVAASDLGNSFLVVLVLPHR